ncbi:MAG TPA: trypsin-like peptidase domain-containing protein, partial [Vicinamibacteria bacterium]|nr:trypsin-like peptidase domain-containing protein [Vicinamibacteria bacterium]
LTTGYTGGSDGAGGSPLFKQRATGSGVVLTADGYIVTNAHVVRGARRVQVLLREKTVRGTSVLKSRGEIVGATVVGLDDETDLAVLKIARTGLPALELGDSEALRQGQIVMAFGSPLGFDNSATLGVVSSVARQLEPESPMIYIQTDAPISPGNSGGPLVDIDGRVVGINTLKFAAQSGGEGLGFAAPSNIVKNVFDQVRQTGTVRRGEIGAVLQTLTPTLCAGLGIPNTQGVLVADVAPGSGAGKAGLAPEDVIVSVDGKPMENARQLNVNLYRQMPGSSVALEVVRGPARKTLSVPVSERERDPEALRGLLTPEQNVVPRLGLLALDLDENVARRLPPLRAKAGVVVAAVTGEGPAWADAPEPGDVIYSLNGTFMTSVGALRDAVAKIQPGQPIVLRVERATKLMYLAAEAE